jgi:hypothetical protein
VPGVENALETRTDAFSLAACTCASATRTNQSRGIVAQAGFSRPGAKSTSAPADCISAYFQSKTKKSSGVLSVVFGRRDLVRK